MTDNWVHSLDMLAANGVLDYDGAAYIRGTQPRYIGNPALRTNPQPPAPTSQTITPQHQNQTLPSQPAQDEFSYSDKPLIENPSWKKLLFAFVAGGAIIFGGMKLKGSKFGKWCGKQFTWVGDQFKKLWNWIKKPFTKKP